MRRPNVNSLLEGDSWKQPRLLRRLCFQTDRSAKISTRRNRFGLISIGFFSLTFVGCAGGPYNAPYGTNGSYNGASPQYATGTVLPPNVVMPQQQTVPPGTVLPQAGIPPTATMPPSATMPQGYQPPTTMPQTPLGNVLPQNSLQNYPTQDCRTDILSAQT